jgi:hypothetical protein
MTFLTHEEVYSIFTPTIRKRLWVLMIATASSFSRETDAG